MRWSVGLVVLAVGCTGEPEEKKPLLDTGWFDDSESLDPADCPNRFVEILPEDGVTDWYWRADPELLAQTTEADAYGARVLDEDGVPVPSELVWDDLRVRVSLGRPLAPSSDHTLELSDCTGVRTVPFRTSALGTPLEGGVESLVGTTWSIDLVGADWVEPGGMAAIMSIYFNLPLLIGVQWVDDARIDLLGSPGEVNDLGVLEQDVYYPSWDFPLTDFKTAPYFDATSELVTFQYGSVPIPVSDFRFAATISADGETLGGGQVSGLGDTRFMGELLKQDGNLGAVCTVAQGVGVTCQDCPDGEPYCLFMSARAVDGERVEGLTLTER